MDNLKIKYIKKASIKVFLKLSFYKTVHFL